MQLYNSEVGARRTRAVTESSQESLLLRGGTVLTMDEQASVLPATDVLVADGRIQAMGEDLDSPAGGRVLDVRDCWVLPGLVQGHLHLGQTFFRGLAEGRRLLPWLKERIWPLEAAHDEESAYWCSLLGAAECLLAGTTTIQDIGIGPGVRGLLRAIDDSGLRALAGMCLMDEGEELPAALRQPTDNALAETVALGDEFEAATDGRLRYLLNPRFILSCSDELWRGIQEISVDRDWPVHTHALEQEEETVTVQVLKEGRDEIRYFDDCGILSSDLRIAHGVWLNDAHLTRVRGERFSVVHCPSANLKLGSGIANVVKIRSAGVPVGIGADGAACNNDLDPFEELRLAALLQQVKNGPASFDGLDALRLATSEGAEAVGLGHRIGSVEAGKAADLMILSSNRPELVAGASVDPHDLIAYGGSRASVRHVLVAGEVLVEDHALTRLNLEEIRQQASRHLAHLLRRADLEL
jgi:cytosine/adenosine deaminase-related metal-dependent hydrolase